MLDYSCLSFPTGLTVDKAVDTIEPGYQPLGSDCEAVNSDCTCDPSSLLYSNKRADNVLDDADIMHGMPISLQLVGRRLEEEKVLAMGKRILDTIS